jgi:hypothetical protein
MRLLAAIKEVGTVEDDRQCPDAHEYQNKIGVFKGEIIWQDLTNVL